MLDWVKDDLRGFGSYIESDYDITQLMSRPLDLAFIGSGLSSSFTLIEFLNQIQTLNTQNYDDKLLTIAIFEKDSWFWGGIPYGRRSGYTTLIITPLDEFLPPTELVPFVDWMADNIDWLITPFNENLGNRSKNWLSKSIKKIKARDSSKLHIPRYFFGIYIWEKLKNASENSNNKVKLHFIKSEVTSIKKLSNKKDLYEIGLENSKFIFTTYQLLLGIGIPEIRPLNQNKHKLNNLTFINDPYHPDLQSNIKKIDDTLNKDLPKKILIVGANASALELIYQITNVDNFLKTDTKIVVISPQGKLPNLFIKDKKTNFCAVKLEQLSNSSKQVTADLILNAFKNDLNYADNSNYGISDTLPIFTYHVGNLIQRLSKEEKYKFISSHGLEIGRLQRRAGLEYTKPVKELYTHGRLEIIKGKFNSFVDKKGESFVKFYKKDSESFEEVKYDIVINCSGSIGIDNTDISPLLDQLLSSGLCKPSFSNHGISVGNCYDVMPGFYINGPMLAGNIIDEMGIWHVEHCGRIISFSKKIAKHIIKDRNQRLEQNPK